VRETLFPVESSPGGGEHGDLQVGEIIRGLADTNILQANSPSPRGRTHRRTLTALW